MSPERWQQIKQAFADALAVAPVERAARLAALREADPVLAAELTSLLRAYEAKPDFLENAFSLPTAIDVVEVSRSWVGRTFGAYRIVEPIGEGGMGAVYRAMRADGLFERAVALKAIRSGLSTDFFLRRFENERRILARLDHPNIARLLDGGVSDEGVPYVVMEFVDGTPIDEYCERVRSALRERLQLFRQVCAAVQYAHRNLIVHRDLKPANILVTAIGEPKLLDFGIAKILDPRLDPDLGAAPTLLPMMTPEFASPEQVGGEPVTTASDVYSLGVILYLLLTGRSPYRLANRSAPDVIRAICETEPLRPSDAVTESHAPTDAAVADAGPSRKRNVETRERRRLQRLLRGELDNIVMMALRKEPERRYPSVEALSADIRRYLDNEPVRASRDTVRYRVSKFLVRHRLGVAAAAIAGLALLTVLALTWREARIAQRRFDDVRSLSNALIFDVHDAIKDLPGSTAARKVVVEKALQYLDKLSQESRGDAALQRELAAGYQRIGDVQGNALMANLGDTAGALQSYRKALALRESLLAAHPQSTEDAIATAAALRLVANTSLLSGDTAGAGRYGQLAVNTAERAAQAQPRDLAILQELQEDYATQAAILGGNHSVSSLGDTYAALPVREHEVAVAERIIALQPENMVAQQQVARSLAHLGDQLSLVGRRREALADYLRARDIVEALAQRAPGPRTQLLLQGIYNRVYFGQYSQGDLQQAITSANRALGIATDMHRADPKDVRSLISLIIDYTNLTVVLSGMGKADAAGDSINGALRGLNELVAINPKNGEIPGAQSSVYLTAADLAAKSGDTRRALRYNREAVAVLSRVQAEDADDADARLDLANAYNALGKLLVQTGDWEGAKEVLRKALELSEPQSQVSHPSEESLYSVAESYANLGDAEAALARAGPGAGTDSVHLLRARTWYLRSLEYWSRIKEPGLLSPGGSEPIPPAVVKQHLDQVNRALRKT
jgi:non-specific serine/threonine protein kinase/serine/threonine-protein kinase